MFIKDNKIREYCGVFGISCNDFCYSVANMIYTGLMAIQHRGQLSSGLSTTNGDGKLYTYTNTGLISKVLTPKKLMMFAGNVGIGHVGYGLPKSFEIENIQPYHFKTNQMEFSIAINGTFTNYDEIIEKLIDMGKIISDKSTIEVAAHLIEFLSKFSKDMIETLKMFMNIVKGAYSIVLLNKDGNLYAFRDPLGYKPLCYGTLKKLDKKYYIISSESCSLDALGSKLKGDILPGEIIRVDPVNGLSKYDIKSQSNKKICHFEYSYFARPDSIIEGVSVADVRYNLGRCLARNDDLDLPDIIVVPIPDSGRSAAMGYALESGLTYQEGLMKNRYLWQLGSSVDQRLNPIKEIVMNNNIILIDDSIISGNTLKKIIVMLKNVGAKAIHVRISCPPIIKFCRTNQSFSSKKMLIALEQKIKNYDNFNEEMRKYIGADSLKYQNIESLVYSIGLNKDHICLDCLMEYCEINDEKENCNPLELNFIT